MQSRGSIGDRPHFKVNRAQKRGPFPIIVDRFNVGAELGGKLGRVSISASVESLPIGVRVLSVRDRVLVAAQIVVSPKPKIIPWAGLGV